MGLLDSLFKNKKEIMNNNNKEEYDYEKNINTIVSVMGNLGVLDKKSVEKRLKDLKIEYDEDMFNRLNITIGKDNINDIIPYLENIKFGYGVEKLNKLKKELMQIVEDNKGQNKNTIITLFIDKFNEYILEYKNILKELNSTINRMNSTEMTETDKIVMVDIWINAFKEQFLGYPIDFSLKIDKMAKKLKRLEYGGYGDSKIIEFKNKCRDVVADKKSKGKSSTEILEYIENFVYQPLIFRYEQDLEQLNIRIKTLQESNDLTEKEKKIRRNGLILDFNEHYYNNFDENDYLKNLVNKLNKDAKNSTTIVKEFEREAKNLLEDGKKDNKNKLYILATIKTLYDEYLEKLSNKNDNIVHEEKIKQEESPIEANDNPTINIDESIKRDIESYLDELKKLPGGGYGTSALDQFRHDFINSINGIDDNDKIKYIIKEKYNLLKENYMNNLLVFKKWKEDRLKEYKKNDKDQYEIELENKIKYLLSLSPKDLAAYYSEDDKKQREKVKEHNLYVVVKYLARKESKNKKNRKIYHERMASLEQGEIPYSSEEIEEAKTRLEMLAIFDEEKMKDDEKLLSTLDWIDGTLFKQVSEIECEYLNKK